MNKLILKKLTPRISQSRWLVALPLFLSMAGCNAQTGATTTPESASTSTAPAAETVAAENKPADKPAEKTPDQKSDSSAPDPKYKVVNEAQPGLPPEAITALDKVKVPPPPQNMATPKKVRVRLMTSKGPITVELNGEAAPLHVKSFLYLSKRGFYDATVFHRYVPGFVIQGGDPLTKNPALMELAGIGGPGYQVPRERNSLKHEKFVFAAARSEDPNSAGSQFYITVEPALPLDEGDGYTVYGKVVDGSENVLKLRGGDKLNKVVIIPTS